MTLCLLSFRYSIKILVSVYLQQNIQSQVLKLLHVDSRAHALRSHQVLKEESSLWIKFGSSRDGEENFQEKIFKRRLEFNFVSLRFFV